MKDSWISSRLMVDRRVPTPEVVIKLSQLDIRKPTIWDLNLECPNRSKKTIMSQLFHPLDMPQAQEGQLIKVHCKSQSLRITWVTTTRRWLRSTELSTLNLKKTFLCSNLIMTMRFRRLEAWLMMLKSVSMRSFNLSSTRCKDSTEISLLRRTIKLLLKRTRLLS